MSKKCNLRIIGIAKTTTTWTFSGETTSHVLFRENYNDNWGLYETRLEIQKNEPLNRNFLHEMGDIDTITLCGDEIDLKREVKVGKNILSLSLDDEDFKSENGKLVIKKGARIKNEDDSWKFSSSHSTTATENNNNDNNLWTSGETNHNHGTEAENNSDNNQTPTLWEQENVNPEANIGNNNGTPVESEEVVKIRKAIERGQEILKSNDIKDVSEMKKIAQTLEDFEKRGSAEAKNKIFVIPQLKEQFNELIQGLKGKAAAVELANQQSGSSQPDQPTQPSQAEILASIQQENEAKKNEIDNKLNQAESKNATNEEVVEAIKGTASNFGDENSQEQQKRQEVLEEKLATEDFELYLKAMIDKVSLCLEENNLKETDLNLTNELRNQWTRLNRKVIQDKDQVKATVQSILEQIIKQGNEKELIDIQKRVKQNEEKRFSEDERKKLVADIMRYIEKTKSNTYVKANTSKGERLLRELNNTTTKQETNKPKEFPWIPVSLGIGAVGILITAVLIIRSRKLKSKFSKKD